MQNIVKVKIFTRNSYKCKWTHPNDKVKKGLKTGLFGLTVEPELRTMKIFYWLAGDDTTI